MSARLQFPSMHAIAMLKVTVEEYSNSFNIYKVWVGMAKLS